MINAKLLRENVEDVAKQLNRRGYTLNVTEYQQLELKRRDLQNETQALQSQRNTLSKQIGQLKGKGEDAGEVMAQVSQINTDLKSKEAELDDLLAELDQFLLDIPNLPNADIPDGASEDDAVVVRTWGERPQFDFEPKDHVALGEAKGDLDFEAAAKISGARFCVLKGQAARLHRALVQFMLDVHTKEHGYQEVYVPYLVHEKALYGTGQLPKFAEEHFTTSGEQRFSLIPTAEVPVTNLVRESLLDADALPMQYVAHTPCFRSEAGSYGKDTRGMIRQHQFEKVELVWMTRPETSYDALEQLVSHAEVILKRLGLPYRLMTLAAGDMGFAAAKTYDLEVWMPGQNCYREISSCSNCEDFQARRLQARWRDPSQKKPQLIHTLNGSGLAVGRTLIALMENYQQADGSIAIPDALKPYLG